MEVSEISYIGCKVIDSDGQIGTLKDYKPTEKQATVKYHRYGKFKKRGTYIEPLSTLKLK